LPACAGKGEKMSKPKGDHKHLTLSQRIEIEKGLLSGHSYAEIARKTGKDPTTISKEVRKHSKIRQRNDSFAPIPCDNRKACQVKWLCIKDCGILCKLCREPGRKCIDICDQYKPVQCPKLSKAPYVCNGCGKRTNCLLDKKIYSAKYADDIYREILASCREGINQTPASIQELDDLVSPLILKGQSIAHIYSHHSAEIKCSRRTLYTYIDKSVLTARNLDLRRKVKYKLRKKATQSSMVSREYRNGRNYEDFQKLIKENPSLPVVEMDVVEGRKGGKVLLTIMFRNCSMMIAFLLEAKTQENVQKIFDGMTEQLGIKEFQSLFQVILTDNGAEFQNPFALEYAGNGETRTRIYYCNPHSSWQKGAIEKNHEYIRMIVPKGKSFNDLTQTEITLMINHINSEARDSLNGCSPFKLSLLLLNNQLHRTLSLKEIAPDEVMLKPQLLK
jgi:IS30 family transposase